MKTFKNAKYCLHELPNKVQNLGAVKKVHVLIFSVWHIQSEMFKHHMLPWIKDAREGKKKSLRQVLILEGPNVLGMQFLKGYLCIEQQSSIFWYNLGDYQYKNVRFFQKQNFYLILWVGLSQILTQCQHHQYFQKPKHKKQEY